MPDGTVYEEVWDDGELLSRKIIKQPEDDSDATPKKGNRRQSAVIKAFSKKPRKPKLFEDGVSYVAALNVTQYMNEKLLSKNSKIECF